MGWLDEMNNESGKKGFDQVGAVGSNENLRRCIDFFLQLLEHKTRKLKDKEQELWKVQYNVQVYQMLRYPPNREDEKDLFFCSYHCMD